MAEQEAAGQAAKGGFGFLARKAGPLPIGVWLVAAAGIWWWTRRGTGGQAGTTDPAGNVGTINPSTGYVYGSAADQQATAAQAGGGTGPGGGSGSTVAGQYADNLAWSRAAVNYLVGVGVDPTQANEAVQSYLSSAPLTPAQQADVNLVIQALGAPPTLPGPTGSPGGPIVNPPGGGKGGTGGGTGGGGSGGGTGGGGVTPAAVTGLAVAGRTATTISLKWNRSANAARYRVHWGPVGNQFAHEHLVTNAADLIGGLSPGTTYQFGVSAESGDGAGLRRSPFTDLTTSTTK